jgi:hypothetical protein
MKHEITIQFLVANALIVVDFSYAYYILDVSVFSYLD